MRQYLLFVLSLVSVAISVNATISEDDIPPVFNADRSVYDPNDHTPEEVVQFIRDYIQDNYVASNIPSPLDADYYLDLFTERKLIPLYYIEEDSCYVCDVPVLRGEWKIYSKAYFETTDNDRNEYIWGTSEQNAPAGCGGGAYFMNSTEWRKMSHPGANCAIQIPQGSTNQNHIYYNCQLKFRPDVSGDNWNGDFIMSATQAGTPPSLEIEGVGTAISSFAGKVDFTIKPMSVYEPYKQSYTVVMTFTDRYGVHQSVTTTVTGFHGTFENVAVLQGGATTLCAIKASGSELPVYNNVGELSGVRQNVATEKPGEVDITTFAEPYIIGAIKDIDWNPVKLLAKVEDVRHPGYTKSVGAGTPLCEITPSAANAYTTMVWENVQFIAQASNTAATDVMRYRFITALPTSVTESDPWQSVNSGKQYFPRPGEIFAPNTVACITDSGDKAGSATQEAYNMVSETRDGNWVQEWYDASCETVAAGVGTAWRADNKDGGTGAYLLPGEHVGHNGEVLAYYVYLDMSDGVSGSPRQAIYWNYTADPSSIDGVAHESRDLDGVQVDVYNMQGVCIRRNVPVAEALDNLPKGIYIYDGHKYMVR